jgi:hypothetical protein
MELKNITVGDIQLKYSYFLLGMQGENSLRGVEEKEEKKTEPKII